MKRNDYKRPSVKVTKMQQQTLLLAGSTPYQTTGVSLNAMEEVEDL